MKLTAQQRQRGFTLIELLVVIGILAILLAITLIAINPARQFKQANDTKRNSDVNAILSAVGQYEADTKGQLPTGLTAAACPVATPCEITGAAGSGNVDFCSSIVTKYMAGLPTDPTNGTDGNGNSGGNVTTCNATYDTGYTIGVSANDNRVTVSAPHAEIQTSISVTR